MTQMIMGMLIPACFDSLPSRFFLAVGLYLSFDFLFTLSFLKFFSLAHEMNPSSDWLLKFIMKFISCEEKKKYNKANYKHAKEGKKDMEENEEIQRG